MSEESKNGPTADAGSDDGRVKWPVYAQLAFPEGDYRHALECYHAASEWVAWEADLAYAEDTAGVIYHPVHRDSPAGEKLVPMELVEKDGRQLTCDFWCDNQAALDRLVALAPFPKGAVLLDEHARPFNTALSGQAGEI